jgi:hypothetical protein
VTAWVMGAVAGQLVVVVGRVVGLALGREVEAKAGQEVEAVAGREVEAVAGREVAALIGRVVGVAEARGLGVALAVGAHPASCACNHYWQVLNKAVAQILGYYYYRYILLYRNSYTQEATSHSAATSKCIHSGTQTLTYVHIIIVIMRVCRYNNYCIIYDNFKIGKCPHCTYSWLSTRC